MTQIDWLERLDAATDYGELRALFSAIASEAWATADGQQLAASIDEAIRRIEHERLRDEDELAVFERTYESFKAQQRGVIGWFKRRIPFTETRRQEAGHRDAISDQQAEILADNLVIARAQMLKEQLLSPAQRRLGVAPAEWRRRFDQHSSVSQLSTFAEDVRELTDELSRSKAFIQQVAADIEAFAKADFSDKEDRQRKKADLIAARDEQAALESEISDEESLRADKVKQLGRLVRDELLEGDSSFCKLDRRAEELGLAASASQELMAETKTLHDDLIRLDSLCQQLAGLPKQREGLDRDQHRLQGQVASAERHLESAESELARFAQTYQDAVSESKRAQGAFEATKRLYDAYLKEQSGVAEVDESSFGDTPVESQYREMESALAHARSQLEEATRPYASAKSRVEAATQDAERARREMEDVQQQLDDLENLRIELESVSGSARSAVGRVLPRLGRFVESLLPLSRNSSLPSLGQLELPRFERHSMEVDIHRDIHGHTRDSRIVRAARQDLDEFARTLQRESSDLRRDLDANLEQHQAAWRARCRELFGESMAAEVCEYQLSPQQH